MGNGQNNQSQFTHNTAVISDLHLSDSEPVHEKKPIWKNFKRKSNFFDSSLKRFLTHLKERSDIPVELILNGDIFDFDSVMSIPTDALYKISKIEKIIGLDSQEHKSLFKMKKIIEEHNVFFDALQNFIKDGNKVVFIIGNHDIELYWPRVQTEIVKRLLGDIKSNNLVFCEWFYVSQRDTLIEHGHQYDPYCMCLDPVNPIIKKHKQFKVRIPFGDLANRNILNTFGLKNPHNDESFVKSGYEFIVFFFKYEFKTQPFLIFNWLFGSIRSLIVSLDDGFSPALKDPLTYGSRILEIADKSNTSVNNISPLKELHAHPAVHNPIKIIRELWLDRFALLIFVFWGSWQFFTTTSLFADVSLWWFIVPVLLAIPFLAYYTHTVKSDVHKNSSSGEKLAPVAAKIVAVKRVVHGHTHRCISKNIDDIEFFNPGTLSPNYADVECSIEIRGEHFIWIEVQSDHKRHARLLDWVEIDTKSVDHQKKNLVI